MDPKLIFVMRGKTATRTAQLRYETHTNLNRPEWSKRLELHAAQMEQEHNVLLESLRECVFFLQHKKARIGRAHTVRHAKTLLIAGEGHADK